MTNCGDDIDERAAHAGNHGFGRGPVGLQRMRRPQEPTDSGGEKPAPVSGSPAPETPPASADAGKSPAEPDKAALPPASTDLPKVEAPQPEPQPAPAPKADVAAPAGADALTAEELDAIKKLPPAEAALAIQQKLCPVSGEHLGSMDTPLKVTAAGKTFFLCCKGCSKDVAANPAEVVAKLKK